MRVEGMNPRRTGDTTMTTYIIWNKISGLDLGKWDAESPEAAHLAMVKDSGYDSIEDLAQAISSTPEKLRAELKIVAE